VNKKTKALKWFTNTCKKRDKKHTFKVNNIGQQMLTEELNSSKTKKNRFIHVNKTKTNAFSNKTKLGS
jgi:hypothetical protein